MAAKAAKINFFRGHGLHPLHKREFVLLKQIVVNQKMGVKYSNLFFTRLNSRAISYRIQSLYKPDKDDWESPDKRPIHCPYACSLLGKHHEIINILPPFNGDGDHLLFRVSPQTYYVKYDMPYYNLLTTGRYSLIEWFHQPYKILPVGFSWFHVNAMRKKNMAKVLQVKSKCPASFVELHHFVDMQYSDILSKSDKEMFVARHRALFMFIFKANVEIVKQNCSLLQ